MADEIVGFERVDAEILLGVAKAVQGGSIKLGGGISAALKKPLGGSGPWMMQATSSISAASGTTFGTGTAKIIKAGASSVSAHTGGSGSNMELTVYNLNAVSISASWYFMATVSADGALWVTHLWGAQPLVRFTLSAALATTDASISATITDQYGPGIEAGTSITVHNLLTSTAGTYVFEGSVGAAGLAMWDQGTDYRIIQIECTTADAGGGDAGGGGGDPGGGGLP